MGFLPMDGQSSLTGASCGAIVLLLCCSGPRRARRPGAGGSWPGRLPALRLRQVEDLLERLVQVLEELVGRLLVAVPERDQLLPERHVVLLRAQVGRVARR